MQLACDPVPLVDRGRPVPLLLLGRVVQASGTAVVFPLLMTTVMQLVPPARRGAFMGTISLVMSVAPALGKSFAVPLVEAAGKVPVVMAAVQAVGKALF